MLCWRGMVIEPIPELAMKLRLSRQGSEVIERALCGDELNASSTSVRTEDDDQQQLVSPRIKPFAVHAQQPLLSALIGESVHGAAAEMNVTVIDVECENPSKLLISRGITFVDLFVLDCEGCELSVLRSFDFSLVQVDVFMVEANSALKIESFLSRRGYTLVACLHRDLVFVHDRLLRSDSYVLDTTGGAQECTFAPMISVSGYI